MIPLLLIALVVTGILCYKRRITALQAALAGFLVFVALYYRINYQYLIIYIPLALLVAAHTRYKLERVLALVIAMLPARGCGLPISPGGSMTSLPAMPGSNRCSIVWGCRNVTCRTGHTLSLADSSW